MVKIKDAIIIGVDVGFQYVKGVDVIFPNGVTNLGNAAPTLVENSLFYEGNYYKIGEGREKITDSKLNDNNARLLTMVAIAKELKNKMLTEADIVLAVGIPFSNYGKDKAEVVDYYNRTRELNFMYENTEYHINLIKVLCFPQCYSAIAPRLTNMVDSDYIVIDIGSKTTDIVYVQKGRPIESKSLTVELAMIKWLRQIQGQLQIQYSKDVPEDEILKVILDEDSLLPSEYKTFIRSKVQDQIEELLLELQERGYNLEFTNVIFIGGGAVVVRNYYKQYRANFYYDCDISANAKGYEFLASTMIERAGDDI